MKLAYWMYAGPAHIGTLRVASSFKNVHAIMHAPLGDDYFNVMRSMLERDRNFTPVTASIVDRHVLARGSQEKVINNITRKDKEEKPDLVILTPTCTSSILQEDLQNFVHRAAIETESDVILADVNHYRVNELQASDRTLEQIVAFYLNKAKKTQSIDCQKTMKPSVNIVGILSLGFHHHHDLVDLKRLFNDLDIEINQIIPEDASVSDLCKLPKAWFNFVPYREAGLSTAKLLQKEFNMPYVDITPMGLLNIKAATYKIQSILSEFQCERNYDEYLELQTKYVSQAAWFSRSIDCQNLTGKTAIVFGDATHSAAMTKILVQEMGIDVLWAGTYCIDDQEWFRAEVENLCSKVVITDDHNIVGDMIAKTEPNAIFGTQMERHIGKRLNIPCGVISSPVHIQNFPLSYKPFLGYEGTNQIADLIYNSFTLGMEDHLLDLFGGHDTTEMLTSTLSSDNLVTWSPEALKELMKIPGFVRGKVKRNTEKFAVTKEYNVISLEIMYEAKEKVNS
uniref:Light-independent protochlorophyllide reductase subunit B n=1 Tax=Helminthora furcellata TaxID=1884666 RepID=A0A1G4NR87_9FLOR|nr:Protochlorophyllide reductase subunit B [Helminthora furcellata]SCW21168.1 Protochlorophyllide reductase subunit B [Helminthora furcellata]SCW24028.1 Protochlorophyllide reductase subunit B [Helminthora furcellata]